MKVITTVGVVNDNIYNDNIEYNQISFSVVAFENEDFKGHRVSAKNWPLKERIDLVPKNPVMLMKLQSLKTQVLSLDDRRLKYLCDCI